MSKTLTGKMALVTGASRGIGKAIALTLAQAGAKLVLAARDESALKMLAETIKNTGPEEALIVLTDMADEASIKNLVGVVKKECLRLDILINNAGVTFSGSLQATGTADWDHCHAVNARGPFILCREALDLLKQAPQGYIINISSVVGVKGYPKQIAYTASKHALRGMSIAMANELKDENIRVHVICPGGVDTDLVDKVRPDIKKEELIQPQEIADLVLYLVTHKGKGVVDELRIRRATSEPWFD